jgi:beta-lactamase regulating signal transducer with metallopeptidase domain
MFTSLADFLAAMLRATAALGLSAGIAWAVLAWLKPRSPRLGRLVWLLVLLQGVLLLRIPVAIPWYSAAAPAVVPAPEQTVGFSNRPFNFDDRPHRPASVVAQKTDAPIAWQPIVFSAWLAGVGMVLVWWAVVYVRVVRCGGRGERPTEEWLSEWRNMVNNASLGASIPLLITKNTGPLLVWRPRGARMLVPRRLWQTLGSQQRLAILRHELAHFRRGDLWKSALIRLLALPHWFNPLA